MEVHKHLQIRHQMICLIGVKDTEYLYNIVFHQSIIPDPVIVRVTIDAVTACELIFEIKAYNYNIYNGAPKLET